MWYYNHANSRFICALAKIFVDKYFVFYCLSWFIIRYTRQIGFPIPILNNWLTDFVFVPLIAHFTLVIAHFFYRKQAQLSFRLIHILVLAGYVSIIYEYIAPKYTSYNTADWGDVVVYFLGAFFYYYIHQPYTLRLIEKWKIAD